jgi:non-ribosomal peptide synthetase component E (peptide arylation enzyme)
MRRFDLENFLANIEKYQINEMGIVPPIVIAIIMSGLAKKYSMASVRYIGVGAAPLGKASQDRIRCEPSLGYDRDDMRCLPVSLSCRRHERERRILPP